MQLNRFYFRGVLCLLMCIAFISKANAQVALSGKIIDEDNLPVVGATIYVESVGSGAVTDFDGNYAINFSIPEGAEVEFAFMGMKTQTLKYNPSRTTYNVTMESDSELMDEVVVVGFGQQKKETVVGSITSADNEDIMRAGNVTTISEALTGILPGVSTMQATGQPGSTAADILIRGQSTWSEGGNKPLYMVDGIERDFNDLDPNEIETISVLKDASATAVYGVKAANGVILVTTKTGGISKPKISFSATTTLKSPTIDTDYVSDYPTTLEYYNKAARNDDMYSVLYSDRDIAKWADPNRNMDSYSYTNWADYLLGNGVSQAYNLNVSGGTKRVKYFTSIGYNNDGDIFNIRDMGLYDPRTNQKRYNYRSNIDIKATKTTKISLKIAGDVINFNGNSATKGSGIGSGGLTNLYNKVMIGAAPLLSNGAYGMETSESKNTKNLLADIEGKGSYHKRSNKFFSDLGIEQNIYKDELKFTGKIAYDQFRSYDYEIADEFPLMMWPANEDGVYEFATGSTSIPKIESENIVAYNKSFYYEAALRYNKTFNEKHNFSALAIMTRREYQNKLDWTNKEESWIGRVTYDFEHRYMFEANGAYNGSEKFAPDKRFGFFPSAAIGWVASEEKFFKEKLSAIEFFKIRYSYGLVGSDAAAPRFAYISPYTTAGYDRYFGEPTTSIGKYYVEGKPADQNATWETSIKQNLGFEFVFLDGRLNTTFDLFDEQRSDIYMDYRTIPSWYGGKNPGGNIGETKNHGFDLELKWNDKIGDFRYWLTGNLSMSENRIVFRDDPMYTPEYQKFAGKPIGSQEGLLYEGMYGSWQDIYLYPQSSYSPDVLTPGDLIYSDYNADGLIDDQDKVAIGDPSYASKTYAFSLGVTWKDISVSAMFNGMFGLDKSLSSSDLWCYASTNLSSLGFIMHNNDKMDSWTPENTDAVHPTLHATSIAHNRETSTYSYVDADFLRLRNLEIKYNFSRLLRKANAPIQNLEVFVSGQNLFTWSALPDIYDPEAKQLEVYPIAKRYNFGIRCTF